MSEFDDANERDGLEAADFLVQGLPDFPEFAEVRAQLILGARIPDADFDRIYPFVVQKLSLVHWTPIAVARKALPFLVWRKDASVLDVGSGSGKFCLLGGILSEGRFTGVEQRVHLVRLSQAIARRYEILRVTFACANAMDVDWTEYESFYLYNPFCENLHPSRRIDHSVHSGRARYRQYLEYTEMQLERAPRGTRVATYHGFGGTFPTSYERKSCELIGTGQLELWIKR